MSLLSLLVGSFDQHTCICVGIGFSAISMAIEVVSDGVSVVFSYTSLVNAGSAIGRCWCLAIPAWLMLGQRYVAVVFSYQHG